MLFVYGFVCLLLSLAFLVCGMNSSNFKLCEKIIPVSYVRQGLEARKVLENRIMQLLEQACTLRLADIAQLTDLHSMHVPIFLCSDLTATTTAL